MARLISIIFLLCAETSITEFIQLEPVADIFESFLNHFFENPDYKNNFGQQCNGYAVVELMSG